MIQQERLESLVKNCFLIADEPIDVIIDDMLRQLVYMHRDIPITVIVRQLFSAMFVVGQEFDFYMSKGQIFANVKKMR